MMDSIDVLAQGQQHHLNGKVDQALECYHEAVKQGQSLAHLYLAYLYYTELEELDLALDHLKLVVKDHPKAYYNLAFVHERLGNIKEAIHYYQKAIQAEIPQAHIQLGFLFECLQQPDQAAMQYQVALFKGLPQANLLLGRLFSQQQEWDQAARYYQAAEEADLSSMVNQLEQHIAPGGKAEKRVRNFLDQLNAEKERGPLAIGILHERSGDYLKAFEYFQKAIDQQDERALERVGPIVQAFHNDEERFGFLKEAAQRGLSESYFYLAEHYHCKGETGNALMAIKLYNQLTSKKMQKGLDLLKRISNPGEA